MPVEFKSLDHGMGMLFKGKGLLTGKELIDALSEIYRLEENTKEVKYVIADYTCAECIDVSYDEIDIIAEKHKNAAKTTPDKVVAVVASKDISFGLSRVWHAKLGDITWETTILRSKSEAELWIKERVKTKFSIDVSEVLQLLPEDQCQIN